ncbi:YtpI family protein [Piscibacillus salipiscarius]|uniref:YtpI family protein n=1 Tax=Piscibacillus salipiscarius TaxID=299480 RepID=A0ABW5QEA2_9BACI
MPILITLFIVSIILYIYFKVKITKSKDPLYMHITNAKARITLGIFVSTFFMNQYYYYQTRLALFITILFLILGIAQIVYGYKLYKHYKGEMDKVNG